MKRSKLLPLLLAWAALACGAPPASQAPQDAAPRARPLRDPAESLERLETSVTEVESASVPLAGRQLADAVRALALSLEPLSHAGRLRMETLAGRMAGAPVRSLPQSGLLREALSVLLDTLVGVETTRSTDDRYRALLRRVAETREGLDELLLLDDQRPALAGALRAAANAVFLARGGEPPFDDAGPTTREGTKLGPFAEQLAQARRDVALVARISLTGSRLASARALASLADMIEVADTQRQLTQQIGEVRFQATRLERGPETALGRAGWIRAGLQAAVDALRVVNAGRRSPWIDEAQRAVAGIDEKSASSFQRAAIQDALRATVDAFAALEPSAAQKPGGEAQGGS
jgi:hypothetical protein